VADSTSKPEEVTEEELEAQRAAELPDRQAMSIITSGVERPVPLDGIATIAPEDGSPGSPGTQ
jgi:hypothetical protein